ncbi:hypothetical protein [Burkholderia lata]|uniref:hypothetical protein n=1 Tax=Burkholderia lata (strain ATCC 17760 / DSM 23089 / LMG 22485 / NCIMB 9086 / R18194 / 383) TaxID=482957 RepID=UPI001FC82F7D|nr:hypothetical protein [Burkholderia lata]
MPRPLLASDRFRPGRLLRHSSHHLSIYISERCQTQSQLPSLVLPSRPIIVLDLLVDLVQAFSKCPQVRWLILEIRALRKSLERVEEWYAYTDKNVANKGDIARAPGQLHQLMHLLHEEMRHAGMR